MAKNGQVVSEGRRRKASPQRIPKPANDNLPPGGLERRRLWAAVILLLLALAAVSALTSGRI